MKEEICAACGEIIEWLSPVVAVRYGTISPTVKHTAVSKDAVDYFHKACKPNIAIRYDKDEEER